MKIKAFIFLLIPMSLAVCTVFCGKKNMDELCAFYGTNLERTLYPIVKRMINLKQCLDIENNEMGRDLLRDMISFLKIKFKESCIQNSYINLTLVNIS